MSFGKAKILRFNDIKPCAPSPAAYNVTGTVKDKTKVVPNNEKVIEHQSPVSECGSSKSVPCTFKTPTLPKRKKTVFMDTKAKPKELFTKSDDLEALKDKIIECENKSQCIKDLTEELEELKDQMNNLRKQKEQLDLDKIRNEETIKELEEKHKNNILQITETFKVEVNRALEEKLRIADEIERIKNECIAIKEENRKELSSLMDNCKKFEDLYKKSLEECELIIEEKDKQLEDKEKELKAQEEKCEDMEKKYVSEIEKLRREHQNEIQDIEFEMLRTMTELQKEKEDTVIKIKNLENKMQNDVFNLERKHKFELQQVMSETEMKIKQMEETCKEESESNFKKQIEETEKLWKQKLEEQEKQSDAILKECQAISEFSIFECELEKNEVKAVLEKKITEFKELQDRYDKIVIDLTELRNKQDQTEMELRESWKNLNEKLLEKEKELKQKSSDIKAYEITIKNSQVTIEVLKKRLINSDRDVEQLKVELSASEDKILEYENKCAQLTSELTQTVLAKDELEMQYESNIKLNESEINKLKEELQKKIDSYKTQVCSYVDKVNEEKDVRNGILEQLRDTRHMITQINSQVDIINGVHEKEIGNMQEIISSYQMKEEEWKEEKIELENCVSRLENQLDSSVERIKILTRELNQVKTMSDDEGRKCENCDKRESQSEEIHQKHTKQCERYDKLLQEFESMEMKYYELKNKSKDSNLLLDNYKVLKQLYEKAVKEKEKLEIENSANKKKLQEQKLLLTKLEETEASNETLKNQVLFLEKEVNDVSGKYAEIVGHHNIKQKIKHLVDIKSKNEELLQNKIDLELKLANQTKATDKLKKENTDLRKCLKKYKITTEDKENIGSPNRSSPFRERN